MMAVQNAGAISLGKAQPETLGVQALDDNTLQVDTDRASAMAAGDAGYASALPQSAKTGGRAWSAVDSTKDAGNQRPLPAEKMGR